MSSPAALGPDLAVPLDLRAGTELLTRRPERSELDRVRPCFTGAVIGWIAGCVWRREGM